MWCIVVCDLENLENEEAMTRDGSQRHSKKTPKLIFMFRFVCNRCLVTLMSLIHHFAGQQTAFTSSVS
jgi:hypothetical protein